MRPTARVRARPTRRTRATGWRWSVLRRMKALWVVRGGDAHDGGALDSAGCEYGPDGFPHPQGPARRRGSVGNRTALEQDVCGHRLLRAEGIALHCISAVDNCLWSIKAQAASVPLSNCSAAVSRRRCGLTRRASSGMILRTTIGQRAGSSKRATGRRSSVGVLSVRTLVAMSRILAAIREALGPGRDLMIDPGWYGIGWSGDLRFRTRRENLDLCERVAPFNPVWVEDFIHPEYLLDYAYVREMSPVPVAAWRATHHDVGLRAIPGWRLRRYPAARSHPLRWSHGRNPPGRCGCRV